MSSTAKTVYECNAQIAPPNEETGFPGQIVEGRYTYEDGVVQLVGLNGDAVKNYSQKIAPDENPLIIARRLTKNFHIARRGKDAKGFTGPINYPKLGWM